jgi:hypothetical protein
MSDPEPDQPGGLMAATLELVVKLARHSNLVNRLEAEGRVNRQGPIADYLTRLNFVIVEELGYLPSPNAANCCSITSASFMTAPKSLTTNRAFGEWPSVLGDRPERDHRATLVEDQ